ncbi:MAG: Mut7-C RNAse domain-containing protein, partial [Deferrisomatales bacterium]
APDADAELLRRCQAEGRVLVTRDRALAARARSLPHLLVLSDRPQDQTPEVLARLGLGGSRSGPFSRCLACNAPLGDLPRRAAAARVPDHVAHAHDAFRGCPGCGRTYWRGSHQPRLASRLRRLLASLHPGGRRV